MSLEIATAACRQEDDSRPWQPLPHCLKCPQTEGKPPLAPWAKLGGQAVVAKIGGRRRQWKRVEGMEKEGDVYIHDILNSWDPQNRSFHEFGRITVFIHF